MSSAPTAPPLRRRIVDLPQRALEIAAYDDVDSLLAAVEHEDQLPFWATVWPAAEALARYFALAAVRADDAATDAHTPAGMNAPIGATSRLCRRSTG